MRVLKWTVPVDDGEHLIGEGQVVHVDTTLGIADEVQVWTWEADFDSRPLRKVQVFGTGHRVPNHANWLGTAVHGEGAEKGVLVWHVFAL